MARKKSWFLQLAKCYKKGYEAGLVGSPKSDNPYRSGYDGNGSSRGGNVQRQRESNWDRGWSRANRGLPLDDSNG